MPDNTLTIQEILEEMNSTFNQCMSPLLSLAAMLQATAGGDPKVHPADMGYVLEACLNNADSIFAEVSDSLKRRYARNKAKQEVQHEA